MGRSLNLTKAKPTATSWLASSSSFLSPLSLLWPAIMMMSLIICNIASNSKVRTMALDQQDMVKEASGKHHLEKMHNRRKEEDYKRERSQRNLNLQTRTRK